MKRSLGARTILYPHPVLLVGTYDAQGRPNLATVAWGGICNSRPPSVAISLRAATWSHGSIVQRGAFTVSIPSEDRVAAADYAGVFSGRDEDKFEATGLTPIRSEIVDAPYPAEMPIVLECRLAHTHELGLHTQFVGEILDVKAEDDVIGANGKPDIEKIRPLLYASGNEAYYAVGAFVGKAYTARRKV